MKHLFLFLCVVILFSCTNEAFDYNRLNNVENEIVTRTASGPWKFAFTWQGVGKDCIAPPKDCGAFQVVNAAITTIQTVLDSDLTESGVQNFFLSNDMNI